MMMLQVNVDADADSTEIMQHRQDIESERLYLKKLRRASTGSWQRGRRITDPELFSLSRDYFTQSTREQDMDIRFTSKHKEKGKEKMTWTSERHNAENDAFIERPGGSTPAAMSWVGVSNTRILALC